MADKEGRNCCVVISANWKGKQGLLKMLFLCVAACILAAGLVWLMNYLYPPVFQGQESNIEFAGHSAKILNNPTYIHSSGRVAYMESWSWKRFAFAFLIQMTILFILFPLGAGHALIRSFRNARDKAKELHTDSKKVGVSCIIFFCTLAVAFFAIRYLARDALQRDNWMIDLFSVMAACAGALLVTFRKTVGEKPEVFFLLIILMIGGLLSFLQPDATTVSWDDGHHFQHALNYSYLGSVRFTQQDMNAMETQNERVYTLGTEMEDFLRRQNENNQSGAVYLTSEFHFNPTEFWTAFSGIGLFFGRLFGLSYWTTWSLGRFSGLLAYALLGFFAIRRLKSGKMILASSLMIPEAVFLASNYSYDPGVTGFIALGMAYCFAQWQETDGCISLHDEIIMLGALFLGCFAKQVYFPVLMIPMFLPKNKFSDKRQRRRFILADIMLIGLLLISFIVPFMLGSGEGDQRGGTEVNAFEQIRFILSHPLMFLNTLSRFILAYINPNRAVETFCSFAYTGTAPNAYVYLIILTIAAFTDKNRYDASIGKQSGMRLLFETLLFLALVLVASSMYIAFTPVGASYVSGCQPRYLIPLIFPALLLLGSCRMRNEMDRSVYNGLLFGGMGYVGFAAVLHTCIALYR